MMVSFVFIDSWNHAEYLPMDPNRDDATILDGVIPVQGSQTHIVT